MVSGSRIIIIIVDHQPTWIALEIEPGFDCTDHSKEVSVQVHVTKCLRCRVLREDLLSDAAKAEPERVFVVRIQPEYRCVLFFVLSNVLDR